MKRIVPFILLFVALLLHGTEIHAQKLSLLESNTTTTFVSQGDGMIVERISEDMVKVIINGLRTKGYLDCNSDAECIDNGLDGSVLYTNMDLKFYVATPKGEARFIVERGVVKGRLAIQTPAGNKKRYRVRGRVISGLLDCFPTTPLIPCDEGLISISFTARPAQEDAIFPSLGLWVSNIHLRFIPGQGGVLLITNFEGSGEMAIYADQFGR